MFNWDECYKWAFSDLGASDAVGINDSGIGIFKRQPYKGLTKEILQNVTDAKNLELENSVPVKAKFELIYIDREDIPDYFRLNEVIHKCYEYYSDGDDGEKLKTIVDASEKYLAKEGKIPVLKISDYNTTGLTGVTAEKGTNWTGLVRERSATNKTNGSSGAFGVGKFAPFTFSNLRTVMYSTKTILGEIAFQGKSILTTFKEDNKKKQNIGLFANINSDNYDAVFDTYKIAPVFRRYEVGTDIFVLGFDKEHDWMEQSALSVLEYFFYSIYMGKLEVEIIDGNKKIEIKKENLKSQINTFDIYYKENNDDLFEFTAPLYLKVLEDPKCKIIKKKFTYKGKSMGNFELYVLVNDQICDKRVLEMRHAGMKIREDNSFRIPLNFNAIFIATGEDAISKEPKDNISSFLRKCENQAHDDWAADEYKEEKQMAKGIIKKVHQYIYDEVKKEIPDSDDETVDAFGLNEHLPNEESDNDCNEERAFKNYQPLAFEIQNVKNKKKKSNVDISMKKNGGSKKKKNIKKEPDIPEEDDNTEKVKRNTNNKKNPSVEKLKEVQIYNVRTPYDSSMDYYRVSFTSDNYIKNLSLDIKMGSDDDNLTQAIIIDAKREDTSLQIKNGMIEIGEIKKKQKIKIYVRLNEKQRKTLEVKAYAKYKY